MAEDAVVERNDHSSGQRAEITWVRVAMKEAELEDLLEQYARSGNSDFFGSGSHRANSIQIVDRNAFDELHCQNARCAQTRKDERYVHGPLVRELKPASFDGTALSGEVEFSFDCALELARHGEGPVNGEVRQASFHELSEVLDDVEIGLNYLGDFGTLHFQCSNTTVQEDRSVHL